MTEIKFKEAANYFWHTSIDLLNNNCNKKIAKYEVTNEEKTDDEEVYSEVFPSIL